MLRGFLRFRVRPHNARARVPARVYWPDLPGEDVRRSSFVYGYNSAGALIQVLKQAGSDLSRENIMRQATNLRDLELPMLLPGIKVNTSPTDYWAVQQLQLIRFDGKRWVRFGDLVYDE